MSRSDTDESIAVRLSQRLRDVEPIRRAREESLGVAIAGFPGWARSGLQTLARGGNRPITDRPDGRVDERDTMFARSERTAGTEAYEDYYERRSELKETDDRIREKPELGSPEALYYDPAVTPEADHYFESIENIDPDPAVVKEWANRLKVADKPQQVLHNLADTLGAVDVGFTAVSRKYVYTEKGRFDENYGKSVELDHDHALVFLVEMDFDEMQHAPKAPVIRESARQYYRAARVAKTMTAVLEAAGYEARAQYDAHYEVLLPPLAVEAGLGEIGRNNILVADKYGSRVRIGAVTTDLPLPDEDPISLGVERFCRHCKRCATQCPSQALTTGEKVDVRGIEKWPTDDARCYSFWRQAGTDCAICMTGCPFSHRNTPLHNAVRRGIKWAPWLAPVFLYFDELLYDHEPGMDGSTSANETGDCSTR